MRDHRLAAAGHRARFVLARRAVPPVGRVLIARRAPLVVRAGGPGTVMLRLSSPVTLNRPVRVVVTATTPARPAAPAAPSRAVVATLAVPAVVGTPRADAPVATSRLDQVRSRTERVVTRTEQRIPQITRIVTHANLPAGAPGRPQPVPDLSRPAPSTAVPPVAPQAAPLDLNRITDHVLTAMDDRLSAYAERLGRG